MPTKRKITRRRAETTSVNRGPQHGGTVRMRVQRASPDDERYATEHYDEIVAIARRQGRPSLSVKGESPTIRVRLARGAYELLVKRAKSAGLSLSEYARRRLTQDSTR